MKCPRCEGSGVINGVFVKYSPGCDGPPSRDFPCMMCKGRKEITEDQYAWWIHGIDIREARVAQDLGLREAAELMGVRPSYLSDIESGQTFNLNFRPELWKSLKTANPGSAG